MLHPTAIREGVVVYRVRHGLSFVKMPMLVNSHLVSSQLTTDHFLASGGHAAVPSAQSGSAERSVYSGVRCLLKQVFHGRLLTCNNICFGIRFWRLMEAIVVR